MNGDDVHGNEMDTPHEFDDDAAEDLLGGRGEGVDAPLADALGEMRSVFASSLPAVGADLAAFMGAEATPTPRRTQRMRFLIAKLAAGVAAAALATGGLAAAGALPGPLQDAAANVGIGHSSGRGHHDPLQTTADEVTDESTTSVPGDASSTTTEPKNHGAEVSEVAHEHDGCNHGEEVSSVASNGKSHNDGHDDGEAEGDGTESTVTSVPEVCTPPTTNATMPPVTDDGDHGDSGHGDTSSEHGKGGGDKHGSSPSTTLPGSDSHGGDSGHGGHGSGDDGGNDEH